jgi:hypothetical protein
MFSLLFQGEPFNVPTVPLFNNCTIFQTTPALLARPYEVESRVSVDSFRMFVSAIGGSGLDITDGNVRDLALLSHEFQFAALSAAVAGWRAEHLTQDADMRLAGGEQSSAAVA